MRTMRSGDYEKADLLLIEGNKLQQCQPLFVYNLFSYTIGEQGAESIHKWLTVYNERTLYTDKHCSTASYTHILELSYSPHSTKLGGSETETKFTVYLS